MKKIVKLFIIITLLLLTVSSVMIAQRNNPTANIKFNYPETINIQSKGSVTVDIEVIVPDGNHIYVKHVSEESFTILTEFRIDETTGFKITNIEYPEGEIYEETDIVLRGKGIYKLTIQNISEFDKVSTVKVPLYIKSQMCNDDTGSCFPPYDKFNKELTFKITETKTSQTSDNQTTSNNTDEKKNNNGQSMFDIVINEDTNPFLAMLLAFAAGLLTFFLPCTYPIVPLTISYLGSKQTKNVFESFINSLIYVLGMSVIYAVLGVVAVLLGGAFGSLAFSPFVLTPLVLLFIYFMFSMFGYYEIQLPSFLQNLKSKSTSKTKSKGGIFIFGMVAGLVATPCALPVVASILSIIAVSFSKANTSPLQFAGNLGYGFLLMFVFAFGLGVFFIVLGTFTGLMKKLPKSGNWMVGIQRFFGLLMAGVVVFYMYNLFNNPMIGLSRLSSIFLSIGFVGIILGILLFSDVLVKNERTIKNDLFLFISVILFSVGFISFTASVVVIDTTISTIAKIIIAGVLLILSILLMLKKDYSKFMFHKMKDLVQGIAVTFFAISLIFGSSLIFDAIGVKFNKQQESKESNLTFVTIDEALALSKEDGKPIFIDFWATWCVNCLEFEMFTEESKEMQEFLSNFHLVKINYDENPELAKRFNVSSLPNFVFIDSNENELHREFGFANPNDFLKKLKERFNK